MQHNRLGLGTDQWHGCPCFCPIVEAGGRGECRLPSCIAKSGGMRLEVEYDRARGEMGPGARGLLCSQAAMLPPGPRSSGAGQPANFSCSTTSKLPQEERMGLSPAQPAPLPPAPRSCPALRQTHTGLPGDGSGWRAYGVALRVMQWQPRAQKYLRLHPRHYPLSPLPVS